jgi:hypothetical protein
MAADAWVTYGGFAERLGNKEIDLGADSFKMALLSDSYVPNPGVDDVYADISGVELAEEFGYITGGAAVTGVTWTRTGKTSAFKASAVSWTASGGPLAARYAVIYDDTATGKPLVAYQLLDNSPEDVTVTDGNVLRITPAAAGIFTAADVTA